MVKFKPQVSKALLKFLHIVFKGYNATNVASSSMIMLRLTWVNRKKLRIQLSFIIISMMLEKRVKNNTHQHHPTITGLVSANKKH